MKKIIGILCLASMLSFVMSSVFAADNTKKHEKAANQPETSQSTFSDPNKAIQVTKESPTFTLRLRSNPTTGYSWFLVSYDRDLITPISQKFTPDTSKIGAPGVDIWTFKVNSGAFVVPQATQITLQYFRPWVVPTNGRKLSFMVTIR